MSTTDPNQIRAIRRASFVLTLVILSGIVLLGLATPFITILFGYLTLHYLGKAMPKKVAILAFSGLFLVLLYLAGLFISEAVQAIPDVADQSIPLMVQYANKLGMTPPFTDAETLKSFSIGKFKSEIHSAFKVASVVAGIFTKEFVYIIIGLVATCAIFSNGTIDLGRGTYRIQNNLYSVFTSELSSRFSCFFSSFHKVMGAQVIISLVNTFFTGLFLVCLWLFGNPLPYSYVIVVVTFLCGLLPIVGNLMSNTVIFSIGLTKSPEIAVTALVYLIVLHKFEYFLNSKIIGGRIKNPMWLTLLGLLVGERLAGIPGMILAPVLLNYLKLEGSQVEVTSSASSS